MVDAIVIASAVAVPGWFYDRQGAFAPVLAAALLFALAVAKLAVLSAADPDPDLAMAVMQFG